VRTASSSEQTAVHSPATASNAHIAVSEWLTASKPLHNTTFCSVGSNARRGDSSAPYDEARIRGARLVRIRLFKRGDRLTPRPLFREVLTLRDEVRGLVCMCGCGDRPHREQHCPPEVHAVLIVERNAGLRPLV
jgi:hypothetical protein